MKTKLFTIAVVALFAIKDAAAQIEEGTVYVGANSNLTFTSTKFDGVDDSYNTFNIGLRGGYFVAENLALGVLIDYQKVSQGSNDVSITTLGLFGRYYINGAFFLGAGYNSSKSKSGGVSSDAAGIIPLEAGYAAFITDAISVEPSLVYAIGTGDNNSNTFGLNVAFALYLGR